MGWCWKESGRGNSKHEGLGVEEDTLFPMGSCPVCWEYGGQNCNDELKPKGCSAGGQYVTFYISVFKIHIIYDVRSGFVGGSFIWPLFLMKVRKLTDMLLRKKKFNCICGDLASRTRKLTLLL